MHRWYCRADYLVRLRLIGYTSYRLGVNNATLTQLMSLPVSQTVPSGFPLVARYHFGLNNGNPTYRELPLPSIQ